MPDNTIDAPQSVVDQLRGSPDFRMLPEDLKHEYLTENLDSYAGSSPRAQQEFRDHVSQPAEVAQNTQAPDTSNLPTNTRQSPQDRHRSGQDLEDSMSDKPRKKQPAAPGFQPQLQPRPPAAPDTGVFQTMPRRGDEAWGLMMHVNAVPPPPDTEGLDLGIRPRIDNPGGPVPPSPDISGLQPRGPLPLPLPGQYDVQPPIAGIPRREQPAASQLEERIEPSLMPKPELSDELRGLIAEPLPEMKSSGLPKVPKLEPAYSAEELQAMRDRDAKAAAGIEAAQRAEEKRQQELLERQTESTNQQLALERSQLGMLGIGASAMPRIGEQPDQPQKRHDDVEQLFLIAGLDEPTKTALRASKLTDDQLKKMLVQKLTGEQHV